MMVVIKKCGIGGPGDNAMMSLAFLSLLFDLDFFL